MKPILYALLLTVPLILTPAQASAPNLAVSMDAETYSTSSILLGGSAPVVTVTLSDSEGAPVAGASVRVVVIRQVQFVGFVSNETLIGTTDADGSFSASVGTVSTIPGTYLVVARAAGLVAQTKYTVGA